MIPDKDIRKYGIPESDAEVHSSSGNVFADLDLPNAADRLAKAELGRQIAAIIRERGQSQAAVAKILGVDQPKVSALLGGHLAGFSLERLANLLTILGKDVEIAISDKAASQATGQVTVRSVPAEPVDGFETTRLGN